MARERRKVRIGRVISDKMAKTVVVAVEWRSPHPIYGKPMRRVSKLYAHDEQDQAHEGDLVKVEETRPLSRLKRWRIIEILERGQVPEVKPGEVDRELLVGTRQEEEAHTSEHGEARPSVQPEDSASPSQSTEETAQQ